MQEEIGITASVIWQALSTKGELSLAKLNREVKSNAPIFDWAIGRLAREDEVVITRKKRSFCVRLKESQAKEAGAS
jgi:hypothetical protein